jgi:hypothetical protein
MNSAVFLVAEADGQVGFGHLGELRAVARSLEQRRIPVARIAIGDRPVAEPGLEWVPDYDTLISRLHSPRVIAWSVRTDRWRGIWRNLSATSRHVWIADVADEFPNVDVVVVPTLHPGLPETHARTRVLAGPEYFPLDVRGPRDVPAVASRSLDVLLSLGGADRTEASLRVIPALEGTKSTVVIGPAFRHGDAVRSAASVAKIESVVAPDGLRGLLLEHRVVISAGGNTLFEAAAAGTPALVAWEDPHEEEQGKSFERRGTARVLGRGVDLDAANVRREVLALLQSPDLETMSRAGRNVVDGRGADRIADVLVELAHGAAA